jgi:hypothetical protein
MAIDELEGIYSVEWDGTMVKKWWTGQDLKTDFRDQP